MHEILASHIKEYVNATEKDIRLFHSLVVSKNIEARSLLVQPGQLIKHEFFVTKGCLKAYYLDGNGVRHIIQFAEENWWVSDFEAFYNETFSNLYIEAIEDTTVLSISYDDKEMLFSKAPIFERYFRIVLTHAFIGVRKRILSSLEKDAKDRYVEFCNAYPSIEKRVQNSHIANYLGICPQSLSRIKRKLKDGMVD